MRWPTVKENETMKRLSILLVLAFLTGTIFAEQAIAQTVRIDQVLFSQLHKANSTTRSDSVIPVTYQGTVYKNLNGCMPDSIRVGWYSTATSDSIKDNVYWLYSYDGQTWLSTSIDTVNHQEQRGYTVPSAYWRSSNFIGVNNRFAATGNASVAAHSYLWMRIEKFFTVIVR